MWLHDARIVTGDCREELRKQNSESIDAIVTDPPYELALMNMAWDATGVAHSAELWREAFRVLKPGAHLLAFASSRTYHRLAVAIEAAGFEIRDTIAWIHCGGFPKGIDVSKAIDRRRDDSEAIARVTCFVRAAKARAGKTNAQIDAHVGGNGMAQHWTSPGSQRAVPTPEQWQALKAFLDFDHSMDAEVARLNERKGTPGDAWADRPITGQHFKMNAGQEWQNRYGHASSAKPRERRDVPVTSDAIRWQGWASAVKPALEPIVLARKPLVGGVANNVVRFGTGALNVDGCRIEGGRLPTNVILDEGVADQLDAETASTAPRRAQKGLATRRTAAEGAVDTRGSNERGPSRFFYVPPASQRERRAGLGAAAPRHPTVKPVALMRYLVRLVTPPGGVVLDPFTGSGTTGIAAAMEGARFIGFELDPAYAEVARARLAHWTKGEGHDNAAAA